MTITLLATFITCVVAVGASVAATVGEPFLSGLIFGFGMYFVYQLGKYDAYRSMKGSNE